MDKSKATSISTGPGSNHVTDLRPWIGDSHTDWGGITYNNLVERIVDTSIPRRRVVRLSGGEKFTPPNDCGHERYEVVHYTLDCEPSFPNDPDRTYTVKNAAAEPFTYSEFLIGNKLESSHPAVDFASLSAEAWQALYPSMSSGAPSLVNFILELRDIKRLSSLTKLGFLRDLNPKYLRRKAVDYAANAHLSWAFGISPFIRDVIEIFQRLNDFKNRLEALKKGSRKLQRSYWRRKLTVPPLPTASGMYDNYQGWEKHHEYLEEPVYVAVAYYRYDIRDIDSFLTKLAGLLDSLGVRLDPSIIWNAIPFTFVVDWFVDVGGWLKQFSVDNLPVAVELVDFVHSVKYIRRYTFKRGYGANVPLTPMWSATSTTYIRRRTLPRMFKDIGSGSGFGLQQGSLSGSLFISKHRLRY